MRKSRVFIVASMLVLAFCAISCLDKKDLKFDNNTREAVVLAVEHHDDNPPQNERDMRHLLSCLPDGFYPYLQALQRADAAGRAAGGYFPAAYGALRLLYL